MSEKSCCMFQNSIAFVHLHFWVLSLLPSLTCLSSNLIIKQIVFNEPCFYLFKIMHIKEQLIIKQNSMANYLRAFIISSVLKDRRLLLFISAKHWVLILTVLLNNPHDSLTLEWLTCALNILSPDFQISCPYCLIAWSIHFTKTIK